MDMDKDVTITSLTPGARIPVHPLLARMFRRINQPGEKGLNVEELARDFLEEMEGQSLCLLAPDRAGHLMPRLIAGSNRDLLSACYYNSREGVAGEVLRDNRALMIQAPFEGYVLMEELSRKMDFSSMMALPVNTGTGRTGILMLFSMPGRPAFTDEEKDFVATFASLVGLLYRYRLALGKLEQRTRQLDDREFHLYTVYQVSKSLSSTMDIEHITHIVADMLVEILHVTHVLIYLTDENEEKMHLRATHYLDPSREASPVELSLGEKNPEWLLGINFESRVVFSFDDPRFKEAFPDATWIFKELDVAAAVPMIFNYKLVGFIALGKKYVGDSYQPRDVDFLSTVAPMAASSISNAHLYEMAILDGLTRVYLGRYFRQRCCEEIKRARRYNKILSIIMWDIDHFKEINDTYGHLAGDAVLSELARILRDGLRQDIDMVARYGGEEFIMLLPDTSGDGALVMAERLRRKVEKSKFFNNTISVTISGGIASFPGDGDDYLSLVEQADIQLYRAKRDGRNQVRIPGLKRGKEVLELEITSRDDPAG